jgi:hypothetical protein
VSPLEYIFRLVEFVHENRSGKCSETDRLVVLTLYLTFVEHQLLGKEELAQLVEQVGRWMNMEQQAQGQQSRLVYTPVYLQLLLLTVHFYPQSPLDVETLALQVASHHQLFRCDY